MTTVKRQITSFLCNIKEILRKCIVRFPTTVAFSIALTIYFCYLIPEKGTQQDEHFLVILGYYLSVGTCLSLSLHLWSEEVRSKKTRIIVQCISHLLLVADAIFLYNACDTKNIELAIAHGAALLGIVLSIFFLSFFRDKDDIPIWNFTQSVIYSASLSLTVGGIMCGGICLLILSLHKLFEIPVSHTCYLYVLVLCLVLLSMLLFLGLLPQGRAKHNHTIHATNFQNGVIRYLFLPLTGGYLFVLYVYLFRILLAWELPNGWVSWPVVILMLFCLVIEYGLYPSRMQNSLKWKEQTVRWLPILILPLLLLMSIGIIRRFNDYGITINRLYLATLNLWFYFVCIGLFKGRAKRISWIPISFSAVFLLTSVLPVNYASITRTTLRNEIKKELERSGLEKLPLSEEVYDAWLKSFPAYEAAQINDKIKYLHDWFDEGSINDLVDASIDFYKFSIDTITAESEYLGYNRPYNITTTVPKGFRYCTRIRAVQEVSQTDTLRIALNFANDTVCIPLEMLRTLDKNDSIVSPPLKTRTDNVFVMSGCDFYKYAYADTNGRVSITIEGELYHNEIQTINK